MSYPCGVTSCKSLMKRYLAAGDTPQPMTNLPPSISPYPYGFGVMHRRERERAVNELKPRMVDHDGCGGTGAGRRGR